MSLKIVEILKNAGLGAIVGGSMLVPGVSGGTMAIIVGIYDKLIRAVGSFRKSKRANAVFLLSVLAGGLLGVLLLAKPVMFLLDRFELPMMYFFIGAVAGGIPLIYKKAEIDRVTWRLFVYPIAGILIVFLISQISVGWLDVDNGTWTRYPMLFLVGIIMTIPFILPGISLSHTMLVFGIYHDVVDAIACLNIPYLLPIGLGLIVGTLLFTKMLEKAMEKHPQPTYLIILGFIIGSVVEVFPGVPLGWEIPICIVLFCLSAFLIYRLSKVNS